MKTKLLALTTLFFAFLIPAEAIARGFSRGGGGGGRSISRSGGGSSFSRPSSMPSRTPSYSRPSYSRPSTSRPSYNTGSRLPSTRPSTPSVTRPSTGGSSSLPSRNINPSIPTTRPSIPTTRPGTGDNSIGLRPSNPPATTRPTLPNTGDRPSIGDRPNALPETRPGIGDRPGERPNVGERPNIGDRPNTLPGDRPNLGNRPAVPEPPNRPARPERPEWGDRWQNNDNKFTNIDNKWKSDNKVVINNFNINRSNEWNNINNRWTQNGWARSWGTPGYNYWRQDVWGYRGNRCREVWYRCGPLNYHNHFFNTHWFGSCWWRPRPYVYHNCSPWWWWRPVRWVSIGFFFGQALQPDPIVYYPGTTVIYEGDTVYINGEDSGDATTHRQDAIDLANPVVEETPIPNPPENAEDEDPDKPQGDWLPVGVWALTQQEQGDATMFMQLSINKKGIVGGAYKNVMTGDEQPIIGQLDFESQRVAWHVGENTTTVYETGLSSFDNDVAPIFVHFGETQTQNWLLVRMTSPEMPPGTVKLPDIADN
ncbi:MAG: hypothetical protein AAF591_03125 [Verrucomicrobiota bacterium]